MGIPTYWQMGVNESFCKKQKLKEKDHLLHKDLVVSATLPGG